MDPARPETKTSPNGHMNEDQLAATSASVEPPAEPETPPRRKVPMGRYLSLGFVLVVVVALVGVLALGWIRQTGSSQVGEAGHPKVAADFSFTDLTDGKVWQLSNLKGQVVVVNFWASWCDPCREEAPTLEATWQAWKDKGVVLLGADINDTDADARAFLKQFKITYPNGPVEGGVGSDYGLLGQPETFIVDPQGNITHRWLGAITKAKLDQWITEAQKG